MLRPVARLSPGFQSSELWTARSLLFGDRHLKAACSSPWAVTHPSVPAIAAFKRDAQSPKRLSHNVRGFLIARRMANVTIDTTGHQLKHTF